MFVIKPTLSAGSILTPKCIFWSSLLSKHYHTIPCHKTFFGVLYQYCFTTVLQIILNFVDCISTYFLKLIPYNLSACILILIWNWTGMLLVFAYACNLRANLMFRPTEEPIDTHQVKKTLLT